MFLFIEEQEEEVDSLDESSEVHDNVGFLPKNGANGSKSVNLDMVGNDPMLNAEVVSGSELFWQRLWALCKIRSILVSKMFIFFNILKSTENKIAHKPIDFGILRLMGRINVIFS